jgi:hypothetical protein
MTPTCDATVKLRGNLESIVAVVVAISNAFSDLVPDYAPRRAAKPKRRREPGRVTEWKIKTNEHSPLSLYHETQALLNLRYGISASGGVPLAARAPSGSEPAMRSPQEMAARKWSS